MNLFQSMQVFLAVAEAGTFSGAAQRMKLSAPSVTRIIAQLEAHLQAQLFQRTTRHVSLTPAGEDYARDVRQILDTVQMAQASLQGDAAKVGGLLRIGCQPSLASHWIAPLYGRFRKAFPKIELDVHIEAYPLANLGNYDIALVIMREGADSPVVARRLFASDGIICASPAYLALHGVPLSPKDLSAHQCLMRQSPDVPRGRLQLWRKDRPIGQKPDHEGNLRAALSINDTNSLLQLTLAGAGIAVFTTDMVREHLDQGRLVHVLEDWITGHFVVLAAVPGQRYMPERSRVFLDLLSQYGQAMG